MLLFTYKILEKVNSSINGGITVYSLFGAPRMSAGGLLQSGGVVGNIWKKAIKAILPITHYPLSILVLGLGCGTAAQIFSKKWPQAKIVGVEIDPVVVKLGKKYFGLDKIPNLEIVCGDAVEYIRIKNKNTVILSPDLIGAQDPQQSLKKEGILRYAQNDDYFDLILVDLYLGEKIPVEAEALDFLRKLKRIRNKNGVVIFNRLFWKEHKKEGKEFVKKAEKVFKNIKLARTVANLLVICS